MAGSVPRNAVCPEMDIVAVSAMSSNAFAITNTFYITTHMLFIINLLISYYLRFGITMFTSVNMVFASGLLSSIIMLITINMLFIINIV